MSSHTTLGLRRALSASALFLTIVLAMLPMRVARAQDPCASPNVLPGNVCNFDNFSGSPPREIPDGYAIFVLDGDLEYARDEHSYFGGGTLRMRNSGGTFKAGIYTQAGVTPGAGYRASLAWGAPNAPDNFGRQLGLDPTGGIDPNAPTVIWGPMHWGEGRMLNYPPGQGPNIDVLARAVSDRMTVFFLVDHPRSNGDELIFVDALALYPDENAPEAVATPTHTPEPPTATPVPQQIILTLVIEPVTQPVIDSTATPIPTETPTLEPTPTPSETPTQTPTYTPSPTITPTWTPWPTPTEPNILSIEGAQARAIEVAEQGSTTAFTVLGGASLAGASLFGLSLVWLRRRK